MSDSSVPKPEGLASPAPPFTPVQVMSSLPPAKIAQQSLDGFRAGHPKITSFWEGEAMKAGVSPSEKSLIVSPSEKSRQPNPTGLSRAEIRLLADAVTEANNWRGSMVGNPDPEPLARFDAQIAKMRAAIRKLKVASGYTFSGSKKK